MELLIAIVAITVFACWLVDNLAAVGPSAPKAPPVLKIVILIVSIFFIAKGASII